MTESEFKQRTKRAALRTIKLVDALPRTRTADVIRRQILRYICRRKLPFSVSRCFPRRYAIEAGRR